MRGPGTQLRHLRAAPVWLVDTDYRTREVKQTIVSVPPR